MQTLPSYVKDTNHALNIFSSLSLSPDKTYHLFLLDVVSLYTSIPHADGLAALSFFLDQRSDLSIPTFALIRLAELVLNLNTFEFHGKFYKQTSGVAMGTKMGPSYACLFMGYLEYRILQQYNGPLPLQYLRYIDDGFGISDLPLASINRFIDFVCNFHPSIQFTSSVSTVSVNFLDITVSLSLGCHTLLTTVFYKPTYVHCYLLYTSSHPRTCRDSLPYSQLLRLRRLCQDDVDFSRQAELMLDFFRHRL